MSEVVSLRSITSKIGSGATPKGGNAVYENSGIAFIRSQNVLDMNFSTQNLAYITNEQAKKLNNVIVENNDILLNITGDSIARCTIVPDELLPARVNQHVSIIRCISPDYANYVCYYLQFLKPYLLQICKVGGTRNALTKEAVENLPIVIQEEYKTIGKLLATLDQKIALNNQINEELEAMAKTLYDYWFVQFDFPDENGNPYKSSGGKMVYNDQLKREIPEGWGVRQLGEICEFRNGINYEKSETGDTLSKIVNVRNISNSSTFVTTYDLDSITLDRKRIESYLVTDKTILITRSGIPGATRIVSDIQPNTIYSGFIIGATVTNMNLFYYVFYHLKNIELLMSNQSAGTIMKNISQTTLSEISIAIPNDEIQKKFSNQVCSLLDMIENNLKQNQELTQLRDWLLPMLMNGQVTVE
ncbi:TPA: restriction endonuclease subunit S [Streptococcus suis]